MENFFPFLLLNCPSIQRLDMSFSLGKIEVSNCSKLHSVRNNGSNVEFEECTDIVHTKCPSLDRFNLQKKNCKKDHQCTQLDKTFRCEFGKCWNITDVYSCTWQTKDPELNCEKKRNCVDLEGMYDCHQGRCGQIHDWKCERRCADIQSPGKNVIIMSGKPSHKG